jgi:two-component system response regulator VicR
MTAMRSPNAWPTGSSHPDVSEPVFELGNLRIDLDSYEVSVDGRPVTLTHQEFELLVMLAREAGRIHAYATLGQALWRSDGDNSLRRLNVAICRLRAKLAGSRPYRIETVRRRGYGLLAKPNGR